MPPADAFAIRYQRGCAASFCYDMLCTDMLLRHVAYYRYDAAYVALMLLLHDIVLQSAATAILMLRFFSCYALVTLPPASCGLMPPLCLPRLARFITLLVDKRRCINIRHTTSHTP